MCEKEIIVDRMWFKWSQTSGGFLHAGRDHHAIICGRKLLAQWPHHCSGVLQLYISTFFSVLSPLEFCLFFLLLFEIAILFHFFFFFAINNEREIFCSHCGVQVYNLVYLSFLSLFSVMLCYVYILFGNLDQYFFAHLRLLYDNRIYW